MERQNRSRWCRLILGVLGMVIFWFLLIWSEEDGNIRVSVVITVRLIIYHVFIRIVLGMITNHMPMSAFHPDRLFYQERSWEHELYRRLHVKNWKNKMPIFDPQKWDMKTRSIEEIICAGCQAEVDHSCNVMFSLFSVCLAPMLGSVELGILVLTAVTASAFDLCFVVIQRYNRPRLVRIADRQLRKNCFGHCGG